MRTVIGTFLIEIPAARTVRALALAGFDFVVLDLEHSSFGFEQLASLISEAQAVGLPAITRVWSDEPGLIGKVLDMGADGVMVPHVTGSRQAREVAQASRYAPTGQRGFSPLISYATAPEAQHVLGDYPVVLVQLESADGFAEAVDIMRTDGIDGVFVGPYDLSQAYGRPAQVDAPEVIAAADGLAAAAGTDSMLGVYVDDPARSRAWSERGYRLQCISFDGRMMYEGARSALVKAGGGDEDNG